LSWWVMQAAPCMVRANPANNQRASAASVTAVGSRVQATAAAGPHALRQAARCQHDLQHRAADGSISERQVDLIFPASERTVLRLMQAWWDRKVGASGAAAAS
jgi:hypothetical protein